ncbi:MAG: peptidoglycan editing factor PgeF [Candidatus Omnitrophica bacterium]|nr:peptidoglycan editing factor PgeF [Candidatus Omnitrophota bacterium]
MTEEKKQLKRKSESGYYYSRLIPKNIICAFTTREHDYGLRNAENFHEYSNNLKARLNFFNRFGGKPENIVFFEQVHKANISVVEKKDCGSGVFDFRNALRSSDAAVCQTADIGLCILTADCLPVFFIEPKKKVIGIAHAGWRGTNLGISVRTVKVMVNNFQADPNNIEVYFGPGIRVCCYEVGRELLPFFPEQIKKRGKRFYLDLVKANITRLKKAGIKTENIFDAGICTKCNNDKFFSFRAGDTYKRMMSLIMIKNK